jgi:hypothetical protein
VRRAVYVIGLVGVASCGVAGDGQADRRIVVEDPKLLPAFEGKLVTIRGPLTTSKYPRIIGVSVAIGEDIARHSSMISRGMLGSIIEATGVLEKRSVPAPENPWDSVAWRTGDFYVLMSPDGTGYLATARLVSR